MLLGTLLSVLCLLQCAFGDVSIQKFSEGLTFEPVDGTVVIKLSWADNSAYPKLDKITYYTFTLNYGSNQQIKSGGTLAEEIKPSQLTDADGLSSYTLKFKDSLVANGQYFIQVYAYVQGEGYTIHYTPRFMLKGMSGSVGGTVTESVQPVPQTQINTGGQEANTINTAWFTIPYTKQTGVSRFAPMQMQPGTKVTATTWSRKYPTSAVTFYSTARKSLQQLTTITPGWSYPVTSDFNYATPAPLPSLNGGWYNPKSRQSFSVRKLNFKNLQSSLDSKNKPTPTSS